VRPHQAFPTVEVRICDAQPEFGRAVALAGLMTALTANFARWYDEGRPLPAHPPRLIEANFWRAIRWGMAGELIDLDTGVVMPARARLEAVVEEVSDVASELGIAPYLEPLAEPSAAEIYSARLGEGESVRDVWPHAVARTRESVSEWLAVREGETR
jgi:carboxylate-amine ligase